MSYKIKTFVISMSYKDAETLVVKKASYRVILSKQKGWCIIKCPDFGIVSIGYTFPGAIKNLKRALDIYSSKSKIPGKNKRPLYFNSLPCTAKSTTQSF